MSFDWFLDWRLARIERALNPPKGSLIYTIPFFEGLGVAILTFIMVSADGGLRSVGLSGLQWHASIGIIAAIIAGFAWVLLFAIPVVGSMLNFIASLLWAIFVWKGVDFGWAVVTFIVAALSHFVVRAEGGITRRWVFLEVATFLSIPIFFVLVGGLLALHHWNEHHDPSKHITLSQGAKIMWESKDELFTHVKDRLKR